MVAAHDAQHKPMGYDYRHKQLYIVGLGPEAAASDQGFGRGKATTIAPPPRLVTGEGSRRRRPAGKAFFRNVA